MFNKVDLINVDTLNKLKRIYPESLFVSAQKELKMNSLLIAIQNKLSELNEIIELSIPYNKISIIDYIYKTSKVLKREDTYDQINLVIESNIENIKRLKKIIK